MSPNESRECFHCGTELRWDNWSVAWVDCYKRMQISRKTARLAAKDSWESTAHTHQPKM